MHKKDKRQRGSYEYLDGDTIRDAARGDRDGLEAVVTRYCNYAYKCLWAIAGEEFGLDPGRLPVEDIMQAVWTGYFKVLREKFKILY